MVDDRSSLVSSSDLYAFVTCALQGVAVSEQDARTVAWALVGANLEGIDSHGVSRLALYVQRIQAGLIKAQPSLTFHYPAPALAVLDADNALGPVAAVAAMDTAVQLAHHQGIGMVTVAHTNHAAAFSLYVEKATQERCIGIIAGNTPPAMAPWGGKKPFLGTNPLAFAAPGPTPKSNPVVIDMATTVAARGNVIMAARQNQPIPEGWAIDADGYPTTNAQAALLGTMLPMAGAKGYALAFMIEILSAVLSGSSWGPQVKSPYTNWDSPTDSSLWCIAIHIDALGPYNQYSSHLENLLQAIRDVPAISDQAPRIPGEQRARMRATRLHKGIPLDEVTRKELDKLAQELGIPKFYRD